jgi:hypothetical protein
MFYFPYQESIDSIHGKNKCVNSVSLFRMLWSSSVWFYLKVNVALNDLVVKVAVKFTVSRFPGTHDEHVI